MHLLPTLSHRLIPSFTATALLLGSFLIPAYAENHAKLGIIEVQASGKTAIAPDMAIISLGVEREAKTAREALDKNTTAMQSVLNSLKTEGIADKDLQTSRFNISPRYARNKNNQQNNPPKIIGYIVSNNLTVRIRDIASVGTILDKVVTLGVNSNGNIQFTNQNHKATIQEARQKAVANAREKANTLAKAADVTLGRILSIRETSGGQPRPRALARTAQFDGASVPIASGENTYQISVSVSWEIKQ
jgi:uncharacterized protein YggE